MVSIPGVDPLMMWGIFLLVVIFLLWLDLGVFMKHDHVISVRESLKLTAFWIALALVFNGWVYYQFGLEPALEFFTGYLLEKSLSMDNLFVFLLIFTALGIPRMYQHRVLFWGIVGAIVMRGIFIIAGAELVARFDWVFFIFGGILIWSSYHMAFHKQEFNPDKNIAVRIAKKLFPVTSERHGHDFFIIKNGKRYATILFVALVTIELTDVVFATDSIPAIFAITQDPFIIFTSNIFAILGLRALYFAIAGLHAMFRYLKYGLALILAFIGVKMFLFQWYHFPITVSLTVISVVLAGSIILSLLVKKQRGE